MFQLVASNPIQLNTHHNLDLYLSKISKTPQEVTQLHALSIKTAALNNPLVYSRILSLYAGPKINNLDYARSVFDYIEEPNLFSWNTIIKCYVENHRSNDALHLFDEMLSGSDCVPDDFTLPIVLKGCGRLCAFKEGEQIHGLVLKIGFEVDMFVQSSLVSLYSKCLHIVAARKVFDNMVEKDLVSWNSLMDGYVKCGEIELVVELFNQMPDKDNFLWTMLVDGLSKCGKVKDAREVFDRMPSRNLASWNAMINGYMEIGDFKAARVCLLKWMEGI